MGHGPELVFGAMFLQEGSRAVRIRLKILDPTSMRLTMRYWFGVLGCGTFCIGTPLLVCHSGKSDVLFQNEFMKEKTLL